MFEKKEKSIGKRFSSDVAKKRSLWKIKFPVECTPVVTDRLLHACPKNFQHVRRSFSTSHPSDNKGLFWLSDFLSVWSFPVNQRLLSRPLQLPACLLAFDCLWPKYAMLPLPALETPPAAALPFAALSLLLFYAGWLRFNAFGHKFARKSTMHARFLTSDSFFFFKILQQAGTSNQKTSD